MDPTFLIGLTGALILVAGAAYPERHVTHPAKSLKNWLFAIGGLCMLVYSTLNYIAGGPIFFIFLQALVNVASIFMMLNVPDTIDTPLIGLTGLGMIAWSLYLFEGYITVFFIIGLSGIGMGYAMEGGTFRRDAALTLGSALIALFSYLTASWIFFWLNIFFAIFSGYYAWRLWSKMSAKMHYA